MACRNCQQGAQSLTCVVRRHDGVLLVVVGVYLQGVSVFEAVLRAM